MAAFAKGGKVENVEAWSEEIAENCNKLNLDDDPETQNAAMKYLLNGVMPKKTKNQFIDLALSAKLLSILMDILSIPEKVSLHCDCIAVLGHIASSSSNDHRRAIIEAGCIPLMISLLNSSGTSLSIIEQAAGTIGKICEKSIHFRSQIIAEGGLDALIYAVNSLPLDNAAPTLAAARKLSWALSTIYGRKPFLDVDLLPPVVLSLQHLLELHDDDTNVNVCRTISTLAEGPVEPHIVVLTAGDLPRKLVELLATATSVNVQSLALRAIGAILAGEDYHTEIVLNIAPAMFLSTLERLLTHDKSSIRRDCIWIISNITAGTKEQVQVLLDNAPTILPMILQALASTDRKQEFDEKQEALWAIHNVVTGECVHHKLELLKFDNPNVFAALLVLVPCQDPFTKLPRVMTVNNALEAILKLLDVARDAGLLPISIQRLNEGNAEEILESCLNHPNEDTVNFAGTILDEFFANEGDSASKLQNES